MNVEINVEKLESKTNPHLIYSVSFFGGHYGAGSPCENEGDVQKAIKSQSDWILKEGDKPIVKDLRIRQKTLFS